VGGGEGGANVEVLYQSVSDWAEWYGPDASRIVPSITHSVALAITSTLSWVPATVGLTCHL